MSRLFYDLHMKLCGILKAYKGFLYDLHIVWYHLKPVSTPLCGIIWGPVKAFVWFAQLRLLYDLHIKLCGILKAYEGFLYDLHIQLCGII